ncbi:MAG: T9SS type A sorting domain-containing protein [Ignavibacteriaceae bacterium]
MTNGYQSWQTVDAGSYNLTEGTHTLQVGFYGSNYNFNYIDFEKVTGVKEGKKIVKSFEVQQNYPNPFNPSTNIEFQIPKNGFVNIKVYNVLGKELATLMNEGKGQGHYSVSFDASKLDLSSGIYFYQVTFNGLMFHNDFSAFICLK